MDKRCGLGGQDRNRKEKRADIWGKDEKKVFEGIDDIVFFPSICERCDDIIKDESKKRVREGGKEGRRDG